MIAAAVDTWLYYHDEEAGDYYCDLNPGGIMLTVIVGYRPFVDKDMDVDGSLLTGFERINWERWLTVRHRLRRMDGLDH